MLWKQTVIPFSEMFREGKCVQTESRFVVASSWGLELETAYQPEVSLGMMQMV